MDSASVESEKSDRITVIDDSSVKETKEMLEIESNFISGCENNIDIYSNIEEIQDLVESVVEEPRKHEQERVVTLEIFSEAQDSVAELRMESVFVDEKKMLDSSSIVEEKQDSVENDLESISQSQNPFEMMSRSRRFKEGLECFLETNEKPILEAQNHEFVQGREIYSEISEIKVQNADERLIDCDGNRNFASEVQEIQEIQEMGTKVGKFQNAGNYCGRKERGSMDFGKKRSGSCSESVKQEMVEKKEKCSRRRSKAIKKISETNGNQNVCQNRGYSRNEMEALRFVNVEEQQKMWKKIYLGLGPVVARELDGMAESKTQKQDFVSRKCTDRRQLGRKKKENAPILSEVCSQNMEHIFKEHIVGEMCSQNMEDSFEEANPFHIASDDRANGDDDDYMVMEEKCDEDEDGDSDDEYENIQRPAFFVEGDPDFESGPPQDGLEYLKRVRWEAAQIPKVKVAKLDRSKLSNEQTVYMPKIPDIAQSPQHLLPSKQWEDSFLADFSELRLVLSHIESSHIQNSDNLQLNLSGKDDKSYRSSDYPMLSEILGMDSVSRASMLRSRIRSFEAMSSVSSKDSAWVFALCAAVDTPFDGETAASLRCLLRKCASLRAEKSESDDELVILNILVTISGRYFGQLEN